MTFRSSTVKRKVVRNNLASIPASVIDDVFDGLTMLYSVDNPEIE